MLAFAARFTLRMGTRGAHGETPVHLACQRTNRAAARRLRIRREGISNNDEQHDRGTDADRAEHRFRIDRRAGAARACRPRRRGGSPRAEAAGVSAGAAVASRPGILRWTARSWSRLAPTLTLMVTPGPPAAGCEVVVVEGGCVVENFRLSKLATLIVPIGLAAVQSPDSPFSGPTSSRRLTFDALVVRRRVAQRPAELRAHVHAAVDAVAQPGTRHHATFQHESVRRAGERPGRRARSWRSRRRPTQRSRWWAATTREGRTRRLRRPGGRAEQARAAFARAAGHPGEQRDRLIRRDVAEPGAHHEGALDRRAMLPTLGVGRRRHDGCSRAGAYRNENEQRPRRALNRSTRCIEPFSQSLHRSPGPTSRRRTESEVVNAPE